MNYGRYEIISEIGRGSMGVVYQAHDPKIDRLVALKVLRQDRVSSADYVKRFLKEATAVGRLSHNGIVTVFDVGQDHGTVYIAMELLEGTPLDDLLKQQQLPFKRIVDIGRKVAQALHYAHQKGIVHRDIKPANIICSENGEVKVTDFGIAHVEDPDGQQLTQAGEILGTPVYMSPEQVLGQPVDGRSDIYSLGVILYELTTGRRPFKAANLAALFKAITTDPVEPPISINPQIPGKLSDSILKAMARNPADRHSSGERFAQDFSAPASNGYRPTAEKPASKSSLKVVLASLLLLLCAAAGGIFFYLYPAPENSVVQQLKTITVQPAEETEEVAPQDNTVSDIAAPHQPDQVEYISQTKEKKTLSIPSQEELQLNTMDKEDSKPLADQSLFEEDSVEEDIFKQVPKNQDKTASTTPAPTRTQSDKPEDVRRVTKDETSKSAARPVFPESWQQENNQRPDSPSPGSKNVSLKTTSTQTTKDKNLNTRSNLEKQAVLASLPPDDQKLQQLTVLKMNSRPAGASIYIDGDFVGKTPLEVKVAAIRHEVRLQLSGHGDWKAQLDLSKGGEIPLSIKLLPK